MTEYENAMQELIDSHRNELEKHGAIDFSAGENYVAYISESDNGYKAEIWSWGVRHDDMEAKTIEGLKNKVHKVYDL